MAGHPISSGARSLALRVTVLVMVLGLGGTGVASANERDVFAFQKDCVGVDMFCTIHSATDPFTSLNGMTVWYGGPGQPGTTVRDGRTFISYGVTIGPSADVVLATGHFRWLGTHGSWTIRGVAGSLTGVHAEGDMTFVGCVGDTCTFALTGAYHRAH